MRFTIFDIEADNLLDKITKIHCLSYQIYERGKGVISQGSIVDYDQIKNFISNQKYLVGHNIVRFDIPAMEKILNVEIQTKLIDTLGLSWYLYPFRKKHNLELYGEELGFEKPKIKDWENLDIKEYIFRCESDVEINVRLFIQQMKYLIDLYGEDFERILGYITFKLDCLKEQEEAGITLDIQLCEKTFNDLEIIINEKTQNLRDLMPQELGKVFKSKPKVCFKKDSSVSSHGRKWFEFLIENNLPPETETVREKPNPGSHAQLKQWLDQLGWKPKTFKVSKNTGEKVPQISLPFGQGVCGSVKDLYETTPALENLEGFYIVKHRLGLIKSFIETKDERNRIYANAHGFTNTMRLQHSKPVVNLPGVNKPYGKEVRSCLIIPNDDYIMCGSDVSGLEDNTKQHYIYFFDPTYVQEMRIEGFDPHIDIGRLAGLITEEEEILFKRINTMGEEELKTVSLEDIILYKEIKEKRHTAKTVNFSATYGAGPPKIAETAKIPLSEGQRLHKIYWKRNAAVKKTANNCKIKVVNDQKWLYNPVSGFYMFLKAEKDRFSTLNQSTGVYVFDSWLRKTRQAFKSKGIPVIMQYHDELLLVCLKEHKDFVEQQLKKAMEETNNEIRLNVKIYISIDWGNNYAECH